LPSVGHMTIAKLSHDDSRWTNEAPQLLPDCHMRSCDCWWVVTWHWSEIGALPAASLWSLGTVQL